MAHVEVEEHSNGDRSHILVVAYRMQGHINPARTIAHRLARIGSCNAIGISLSIPISGHRCLFPSIKTSDEEVHDGVISYIPYSDGKNDGSWSANNPEERRWRFRESSKSLSAVVDRLAASGRPVKSMVCTLSMPWVVEVARQHKIPVVILESTFYHYFHGHQDVITPHVSDPASEVSLPGLNPLGIGDMPTFFVDMVHDEKQRMILQGYHDLFEQMDQEKPLVMVNTFDALEYRALEAIRPYINVVAVGPAVSLLGDELERQEADGEAQIHLFKQDGKDYKGWLDTQPKKSVVYVSFGSLVTYSKQQVEEIWHGLHDCGRPRILVGGTQRGATEDVDSFLGNVDGGNGMVVEWCNQLQSLSHPSIGCFVTHCGWNSVLEALVSGVAMLGVPNWSDQPLSACLVEKEWSVGIRAECDKEGVLTSAELVKSVELLMGNRERATKIKESTDNLKQRAQEAIATDGLSRGTFEALLRGCNMCR